MTNYLNLKSSPSGWPLPSPWELNPDSWWWEEKAGNLVDVVVNLMGYVKYVEVAETLWPGPSIGTRTWKQICTDVQGLIDDLDPDCTCPPIGGGSACDACREYAAAKYGDRIPFRGE